MPICLSSLCILNYLCNFLKTGIYWSGISIMYYVWFLKLFDGDFVFLFWDSLAIVDSVSDYSSVFPFFKIDDKCSFLVIFFSECHMSYDLGSQPLT